MERASFACTNKKVIAMKELSDEHANYQQQTPEPPLTPEREESLFTLDYKSDERFCWADGQIDGAYARAIFIRALRQSEGRDG